MRPTKPKAERFRPSPSALWCLTLGAFGAALAATSGWTYAGIEGFPSSDMFLHRWSGVVAAGLAATGLFAAAFSLVRGSPRAASAYRGCLLLGAAAVGLAGHFGGGLVHGPNFVLAPLLDARDSDESRVAAVVEIDENEAPASAEPTPPTREPSRDAPTDETIDEPATPPTVTAVSFQRDVLPILQDSCVRCHGPRRQRAKLRLDTRAALLEDAVKRGVIIPGDPSASELVRRITLPSSDDDAMPPGDDRLPAESIEAIRTWIAEGATWPADATAVTPATPVVDPLPEPRELPPAPRLTDEQRAARDATIAVLRERGVFASPVAVNLDETEVSFARLGDAVENADLDRLTGLESSLVRLNLATTGITDDGLASLAPFTQLRRLTLHSTAVGDTGVTHLATLPALEVLNLHSTQVTDDVVKTLEQMPALRRVYLWQSKVTRTGAASLRAARPDVEVIIGD